MKNRIAVLGLVSLAAALMAPGTAAADDGLHLFVGVERAAGDLSLSTDALVNRFGGQDFQTDFYIARVGTRLGEHFDVEIQVSIPDDDGRDPGRVELGRYVAAYLAPTATVEGLFEVSTLIGYSGYQVKREGVNAGFKGVAYGLRLGLPLKLHAERLPDLRLDASYLVYGNDKDGRLYGWQLGLRYDFRL